MTNPPPGEGEAALARVWDLPVRMVHWAMAALLPTLWWTAEQHMMDWHRRAGFLLLALLVFRTLWGLFGSSTARFATFVRGPMAVGRYARSLIGRSGGPVFHGHNPMGGWSVIGMLGLLALQIGLGLFAVDVDGIEGGPLSIYVSFDTARGAAELHEIVFNLLLVLVALHIAAVLSYLLFKRENLISPMVRGARRARPGEAPMRAAPLWRAVAAAAVASGVAYWVSKGAPNPLIGVG
ncbi:MAG: hypothetical protein B7Y99_11590 [Caulobacterales bacterium 32-69-10]|nr:MAG: hypothetical protein B7Y99_11590 [Caulobacterales bacterium 32-69-10]